MQKRFETTIQVRPSDMDINFHVHLSKYLEYILFARMEQMDRCYHLPIAKFVKRGMSWVVRSTHLNFHSSVRLGDEFRMWTWVEEISGTDCLIAVEGKVDEDTKISGAVLFCMVDAKTGQSKEIPDDIREQLLSFKE